MSEQGNNNNTIPSQLNNVPVIEIDATEGKKVNLFLEGHRDTIKVAAGGANHTALLDAYLRKNETGKEQDGYVVIRYVKKDDDGNKSYVDQGTLVKVHNAPAASQGNPGTVDMTFSVLKQVTVGDIIEDIVPIDSHQSIVKRADCTTYSARLSFDDYRQADPQKAAVYSANVQKLFREFMQYKAQSGKAASEELSSSVRLFQRDPFLALSNLVSKYGREFGPETLELFESLLKTSNDPDLYAENLRTVFETLVVAGARYEIEATETASEKLKEAQQELIKESQLRQQIMIMQDAIKRMKKELGEDVGDVEFFKQALQEKSDAGYLPSAVVKECKKLISKIEGGSALHNESNRRALEIFLSLFPFDKTEIDRPDIHKAQEYLDSEHYGLEDAKNRILEQLAVDIKRSQETGEGYVGKPLLLIGPKGIGKTTLAKSIAKATGRTLAFVPFGGVNDPNELRGHGKTYVGSKEGSVIRAFCDAEHGAPLLYIDEIDKSGADQRGNPQEVLMALTDPSQNKTFKDNFLEIPMDLSRAKIVATANHYDRIDPILMDRFEIIHLGQYSLGEKLEIAKQFILPRMMRETGLTTDELELTEEAYEAVIKGYTREPGVRQLEAAMKKICEKAVIKVVRDGHKGKITLTPTELESKEWLNTPYKDSNLTPSVDTIGWVNGLYGSQMGGGVLPIKSQTYSSVNESESQITHTGQFQNMMQESLKNVSTVVKSLLDKAKLSDAPKDMDFDEYAQNFKKKWRVQQDFHIEAVGNTKVEGPSAGITMTTAIISQIFELPVACNVGMTGKIDIHGDVHGIGGLEQKIPAAREAGLTKVLIPMENKADYERLKDDEKEGVEVVFVETIEDVLRHAIPGIQSKIEFEVKDPQNVANQNKLGAVPPKKNTSGVSGPRQRVRVQAGSRKVAPKMMI